MIVNAIKRQILLLTSSISRYHLHNRPSSNIRSMSLSRFLADSKQRYLSAVREGKGRNWIVVMGNEAGDLDSVASSIAYSWFASTEQKISCVALIQTPRNDLRLRPENMHAFMLASLSSNQEELLCIDDIPPSTPFPSNQFALVDHNRLLPQFSDGNENVRVVAVLDHHDDEGLYKDTAEPRTIVVPMGSASSIVARHIEQSTSQIQPEIARLLLCALLVDTSGLKPGGKAEELDRAAAAYLLQHSELGAGLSVLFNEDDSAATALTRELLEKKSDIAHLSTIDLLRRDYKQYAWAAKSRTVQVGLTTVPVDLRVWLARGALEDFWREVDAFMDVRKLDILGILTTFSKERRAKKKLGENGESVDELKKGKHSRQMLIVVRDVPDGELEERVYAGLERAPELALEHRALFKFATKHQKGKHHPDVPEDGGVGDRMVRAYKQGNAKATRKVIAPLLKRIIEGESEAT